MIAVQYLEPGPETANISPAQAAERLQAAFDHLPIDLVILGWNLPPALLEACAQMTQQGHARLYSWQPLLTGQDLGVIDPAWQVIGLNGEAVEGSDGKPEFTFLCPNKPAVQELTLERLRHAIKGRGFQGVFPDRLSLINSPYAEEA